MKQFDPQFKYFLVSEAHEILLKNELFWDEVASKYQKGDFSPYQSLNQSITKVVARAKNIRKQVIAKLLLKKDYVQNQDDFSYYSKGENELFQRWEVEMEGWLSAYAKENDLPELSLAQKQKVFGFHESRIVQHEEVFLSQKQLPLQVLKAVSGSLDAHTMCYSEEEASELRNQLRKEFCGVGIQLKESVDGPFVSYIVPHSPAEAAGLINVGDKIKEIEGVSTDKINFNGLLNKLIGNPFSTVSLTLEHQSGERETVKLIRQKIALEEERIHIEYEPFGDGIIGVIRISSFYDNGDGVSVQEDLKQALSELKAIAPIVGLVLDMRQNCGGFLQSAVQVAGLFLQSGTVLVAKYANNEIRFTRNLDPRLYYQGPLLVLHSKASASAAEIVSQSLQDEGVAIVVGDERSFGKGTLQYQNITDPHAKFYYKVTVGRYFTLSGKTPQLDGVKADIVVPTVYSALNLGEKYLRYPLHSQVIGDVSDLVQKIKKITDTSSRVPSARMRKMIPYLVHNSALRKESDENLKLFYSQLQDKNIPFKAKTAGCGSEDLQKREAINIIKDMILISQTE